MNREKFIRTANERYRQARDFWRNWRVQAMDDYAFIAGKQWLEDDERVLNEEKRPPITFNYSEKMVDAVVGAEVNNRQEVSFLPRGVEDTGLAELWNSAAQETKEECNAEDEESDAFRDMLICGLGLTFTDMDYERNLDGDIDVSRIDPLEMFPDPAASKSGLRDRRWNDREYWTDEAEARKRWPNAHFHGDEENASGGVITHGQRYDEQDDEERERRAGQVKIRLHETYELEPVYRVASGDQIVTLAEADFKKLTGTGVELPEGSYVRQRTRVYYRAFFSGESLLELQKSPCQEGFCFNAITGKRDRNKNYWYGLTRVMKDPQRWANKWLSQILHIINTNAKGGVLAEIGAFVDPVRAQEEWSRPDSLTLLNEGALSGKKVQQKQTAPYPAGLDKLMEFALGSLPMVTGINLEALGLANREQAGVLEDQRKQAAYGMLAPMFNSLRLYRKEQGRVLLYFIRHYISDGRLVRIGGPERQEFLPLTKQQGAARFDIKVDQSPHAPDTQDKTWKTLVEIIPAMLKAGLPLPPNLLDYTPLPASLVIKWKQFIGDQAQVNEKTQEEIAKLQEENAALKRDQQIKMAELQFEQQAMAAKIQMEREAHEQKMQLERMKAQAEFELESFKQDREFELEARRASHEAKIMQQKTDNEFKVKAFAAGVQQDGKPDGEGGKDRKVSIGIDTSGFAQLMEKFAQTQEQQTQLMAQALSQLAETMSKPRSTKLITNASGMPVGSETSIQ